MGVSSFIFHSPPIPPPSGKGANTAIFGLTTFLLAASPCRVVRKKKKKVFQPKKRSRFRKSYRRRLPRPLTVSPNISSQTYETEEVYRQIVYVSRPRSVGRLVGRSVGHLNHLQRSPFFLARCKLATRICSEQSIHVSTYFTHPSSPSIPVQP